MEWNLEVANRLAIGHSAELVVRPPSCRLLLSAPLSAVVVTDVLTDESHRPIAQDEIRPTRMGLLL